ncbi:MAG: GlsB/YeaQ/YmgE family stress response membrane protein [Anaerolineaceae bacterium]|jgi:uncharacterized membrane protein YeaQ/YmgE (transglycosylase-associated protein family)|nr:GlsB/YeaQ/YmgE family stress response membrane protein [Anaerolineaceae bacterium]
MNILVLILVGLVAGFIADKLIKNTFGLLGDLLIGIAGSFLGTWIFGQFGIGGGGLIEQIIYALVGAVLLLIIINLFKRKK